jgi:hypothetical protein
VDGFRSAGTFLEVDSMELGNCPAQKRGNIYVEDHIHR